jgi:DNA-directed RNA polymerase specialized sigma24 family protein
MEVDLDRPVYDPGKGGPSQPVYDVDPFAEEVVETKMPVGVMEELVARLLSLPQELRDVVCWRFTGLTYPEIARVQRITTAGAEARHERAMRLFPELRELFIVKTARQKMRETPKTVSGCSS